MIKLRELGLDPAHYETHSMRRTTATLIYRRTTIAVAEPTAMESPIEVDT